MVVIAGQDLVSHRLTIVIAWALAKAHLRFNYLLCRLLYHIRADNHKWEEVAIRRELRRKAALGREMRRKAALGRELHQKAAIGGELHHG